MTNPPKLALNHASRGAKSPRSKASHGGAKKPAAASKPEERVRVATPLLDRLIAGTEAVTNGKEGGTNLSRLTRQQRLSRLRATPVIAED